MAPDSKSAPDLSLSPSLPPPPSLPPSFIAFPEFPLLRPLDLFFYKLKKYNFDFHIFSASIGNHTLLSDIALQQRNVSCVAGNNTHAHDCNTTETMSEQVSRRRSDVVLFYEVMFSYVILYKWRRKQRM